jgi:hypothetical protein
VVELKKKPPPLVVTMEDGTKRSILVDPTALGGDLAEVIVEGTTEDHNKRYHRIAIHPAVHHHLLPRLTPPPLYSSFCRPQGAGTVRFRPLLRGQRLRRSREGPRGSPLLVSAVAQHVGQLLDRQASSPAMAQQRSWPALLLTCAPLHTRTHARTHAHAKI